MALESCVATTLDIGRLPSALRLVAAWPGPLSAAVLARAGANLHTERRAVQAALLAAAEKATRVRIALVENTGFDCPARFPFNMLRNVALSRCIEEFVVIIDVDFVPMPWQRASASLRQLAASLAPNTAVVLPAFEDIGGNGSRSRPDLNKRRLRELLREGGIVPFGSQGGKREQWLPAHSCTRTAHWLQTTSTYRINHCHPQYEPYVMLPRAAAPRFDESFAGRGFDKTSFIYELFARGLQFVAAPDAFVVHRPGPHEPAAACNQTVLQRRAGQASARSETEDERAMRLNPGETCVRGFLARIRSTYRYAPTAKEHAAFRRDVQSQGWKCNAWHEAPLASPRVLFL